MRKIILIGTFLWAALGVSQTTGTATKITVSGFAVTCPASTPTCAANGYALTITPPSGAAIVQQIPAGATTFTYTSPTLLNYGTYKFSMVTNASSGLTVSPATTATTVYAIPPLTIAPAPGGMTVTFQ